MQRLFRFRAKAPVFAICILASCGQDKAQDRATTAYLSDQETAHSTAASSVEEAADAAADNTSSSGFSLVPPELTSTVDISIDPVCTAGDNGSVTVVNTYSGSFTQPIEVRRVPRTVDIQASGTETRKWTPPSGQTLECNPTNGRVKIPWRDDAAIAGLAVDVTVDRSRSLTVVKTVAGETKTMVNNATVSGQRSVVWAAGSGETSTIVTRTKTITISGLTRSRTFTKQNGSTLSISTTQSTKAGAPLVVEVVRSATDGSLQTKTIVQGTMVATLSDGGRAESTFSNVLFDITEAEPGERCVPKSGTITVNTFLKDETTASSTFTITFGTDGATVAQDEETATFEYDIAECDLKREN